MKISPFGLESAAIVVLNPVRGLSQYLDEGLASFALAASGLSGSSPAPVPLPKARFLRPDRRGVHEFLQSLDTPLQSRQLSKHTLVVKRVAIRTDPCNAQANQ